LCQTFTRFGKLILDRGLTFDSTGNISLRVEDGWLITPLSQK
jgi:ribulose-5-phosphate 4-epimerase/fuculose-1-phosphate aldolase